MGFFVLRAVSESPFSDILADTLMTLKEYDGRLLSCFFGCRASAQHIHAYDLSEVQTPVSVDINAHEQEFLEEDEQDIVVVCV